jgi:uncharacterized membrane protein
VIILGRNVAWVMIGLSIFMFTIAVTLDDSEILNLAESAFALNFLAIFSVLFMAVGIYLLIFNMHKQRKAPRRGHHFNTAHR